MNLCSDSHQEVCFEGRSCPVCSLRDELEERITDLEEDVKRLEREAQEIEQ